MAAPGRSTQERRQAALDRRARRAEVTDPDVVMEAATAFLAVRSRSVAETRRRLLHHGYPAGLCDDVIDRLISLGYLDDRAFAQAWVESRDRARPRGSTALRQELAQKGISREIVEEVLEARAVASADDPSRGSERAGADLQAARRLLERRVTSLQREPDPRRRRHRAYALLARHGFSPDVCRRASADLGEAASETIDEDV